MAKKNIVRFQVIIVVFYLILSTASSLKLVNKMTTICSVKLQDMLYQQECSHLHLPNE